MARSRGLSILVLAALVSPFPHPASGQTQGGSPPLGPSPPASDGRVRGPGVLTLVTEPKNAYLALSGSSGITGRSPIDVPASITGRYKIVVQGAGFSKAQGSIYIPPKGGIPFVASESQGVSAEIILRGL